MPTPNPLEHRTRRRRRPTKAVLSLALSALAMGALGSSAAYAQERAIGEFSLVSVMHGKCITAPDVVAVPPENVPLTRMMPCNGADDATQRWTYSPVTGEFKTHLLEGIACLDAYKARRGDPIMTYLCRDGHPPGQAWDMDSRGRIVLRGAVGPEGQRYCATIANGDRSDGARLWLQYCHRGENQFFRRDRNGTGGSTVSIESDLRWPNPNPPCVDTTPNQDAGRQLTLWQCLVPDHIHQRFERTAAMEFRVASRRTLCIDGGNGTRLGPVTLQACHGGISQKWNMVGYGELQFQGNTSLCLSVPNDRNDNGTKLVVDTCNTAIRPGQQWSYRNPA